MKLGEVDNIIIPDHIMKLLENSKEGYITVTKISDNNGYLQKGQSEYGHVKFFGEGLAVMIDRGTNWYRTSNVQKIDWENNIFTTLNSTYEFKFEEKQDSVL